MSALTVVANRLPVRFDEAKGEWEPSPGGLVAALAPVLRERSGRWVGWVGSPDRQDQPFETDGFLNVPVPLSSLEVEDYYEGFCNGTVWPLYHDAIRPVEMHRHWWRLYQEINRRFADVAASTLRPGESVWVQDYQLQLVPRMIRDRREDVRIGFFLHIPFPPPEIFSRLPWRRQIIEGLLGADVVAFHTRRDVLNFARSAREHAEITGPAHRLSVGDRTVRVESVPISIDYESYAGPAAGPDVTEAARRVRLDLGDPDFVMLGVDRLDYTKGIDIRLRAFETLLERRPDLHGRVVMVQLAVPSREAVGEYQLIRDDVERLVGRINGAYGRTEWVPVHYRYRSLPREELIAHYRAADVLAVTPLRDGMNLVAKEYVACRVDDNGALVLSEFAGAAEQLTAAIIVNPYDVDALADALGRAVDMNAVEQRRRMTALRRGVRRSNVYAWAHECLAAIDG
ncbi:MAG TPA: trehalose-6-phosphate synthase [Acidimicrobiia bacterium]